MKFELLPSYLKTTSGETDGYLKIVDFNNDTKVEYNLTFKCSIKDYNTEIIGKPLIIEWAYSMGYNSISFYNIENFNYYKVTEVEIPATNDDLKKIVSDTHKRICNAFKEKKEKVNAIRPVKDLTDSIIQQAVQELKDELLHLQA